jgi:NAD(P)-dependent dehydrogenase (short-subunit alcohol dehydrogenase family)
MNLNDKICVITGSGNGIGEQCALKFAEYGATLFLIDIDEKI